MNTYIGLLPSVLPKAVAVFLQTQQNSEKDFFMSLRVEDNSRPFSHIENRQKFTVLKVFLKMLEIFGNLFNPIISANVLIFCEVIMKNID
jgi:hypothetical protein